MKFTKTDTVKVFKFEADNDHELVAARNKEEAVGYMKDMYENLTGFIITELREKVLRKEMGCNSIDDFYNSPKPKNISAYTAVKQEYKKQSLPFIFWTTHC